MGRPPRITRDQLLETARGVFAVKGFEAATLARDRYQRFQAELRYASDALDDASESNLRRLEGDAERLIAERTADIETLCEEIAG